MNHAMNSTIQAMMNFLFMVSPSIAGHGAGPEYTGGAKEYPGAAQAQTPGLAKTGVTAVVHTAVRAAPRRARADGASCATSVGPSIPGALLPDWRLTDWRHQVLIGGTRPHHVRALGVWIRALGIGVIESGIGSNDHDVRPGLDPVVGSSRLCRVRVGVAGVGAPGEHIHESDFSCRWRLVIQIRINPVPSGLVPAHRVRARCCGIVRHTREAIAAFSQ